MPNNNQPVIAFVHEQFPFGGGEKVTSILSDYLAKKDYQIFVLTHTIHHHLLSDTDKQNITLIEIDKNDWLLQSGANISKQIELLAIDIVIFVGKHNTDIHKVIQSTNCKYIFAYHGMPFWEVEEEKQNIERIISNESFFRKVKYKLYKRNKLLNKKKKNIKKEFLSLYHSCDAFTVLCQSYKEAFVKELGLTNADKMVAITNAILTPPITYNYHKKKQILYLGRMSYADKRVDRLIQVWKNIYQEFLDWEFILVGDGAEKEQLEQQAKAYGLDRIRFCGATKTAYEYYNEASILCLSSQFEALPLVLLEAQQAGVIPIAFNCSAGVQEILEPSWVNGVLIDNYSLVEYTNALKKLMRDDILRQKIQQNILLKAHQYDIHYVGEMWHQLFKHVMTSIE